VQFDPRVSNDGEIADVEFAKHGGRSDKAKRRRGKSDEATKWQTESISNPSSLRRSFASSLS
jgi:hypothetical protein